MKPPITAAGRGACVVSRRRWFFIWVRRRSAKKETSSGALAPGLVRTSSSIGRLLVAFDLAGAAADRRVVERDVAAAAALAAGGEAIAARLENRAAGLVAGDAGDAAAVLGVLTLASATGEVALAAADAVLAAADAAESVAEHAAEILQRATSNFVFATTMDLESAGALFEFDFATRQNTPIGGGRRASRDAAGLPAWGAAGEGSNRGRATFQHNTGCHKKDSFRGTENQPEIWMLAKL